MNEDSPAKTKTPPNEGDTETEPNAPITEEDVELEANYRSYGSPAIAHKRAEHLALKPIDRINLQLVHHELYCAT